MEHFSEVAWDIARKLYDLRDEMEEEEGITASVHQDAEAGRWVWEKIAVNAILECLRCPRCEGWGRLEVGQRDDSAVLPPDPSKFVTCTQCDGRGHSLGFTPSSSAGSSP